jgi:predicted esterase
LQTAGASLDEANAAIILVHGRGASAESILQLRSAMDYPGVAYLAPQAYGNTWYPYSFLAPLARNEPELSSALRALADTVSLVEEAGIPVARIVIGGFSQGACLASEFVARHPRRYGGLLVFSGGLIGPIGMNRSYAGSLDETPVFLGCSDRDPHIPLERVDESETIFRSMGGHPTKKIYPNMGHTIVNDEIDHANRMVRAMLGIGP